MTDIEMEAVFDTFDAVDQEQADELLGELAEAGLSGSAKLVEGVGVLEVAATVALVTVAATTVTGLCIVVVFMQRAFAVGVIVDASGKRIRVRKNDDLPRGSVLVISPNGQLQLQESISGDALRELMTGLLHAQGSKAD